MLFKDIAVGSKFKIGEDIYTKVDEVGRSCCRAGYNATKDGVAVYIDHNQAVEPVDQ